MHCTATQVTVDSFRNNVDSKVQTNHTNCSRKSYSVLSLKIDEVGQDITLN